jgi:hypothetical protein
MIKPWPLISSQPVSDHGLFQLTKDRAQSPRTGSERDFMVIHMPDWLQMVALTSQGELVLVRQYRHGSRGIGLEVPGGLLDAADPDPASAAARGAQGRDRLRRGKDSQARFFMASARAAFKPGSLLRHARRQANGRPGTGRGRRH